MGRWTRPTPLLLRWVPTTKPADLSTRQLKSDWQLRTKYGLITPTSSGPRGSVTHGGLSAFACLSEHRSLRPHFGSPERGRMSDFRDKRGGAYDPVTPAGNPQPPQVRDTATPHQKAQWGADVRPEPLPGPAEGYPLPEGLEAADGTAQQGYRTSAKTFLIASDKQISDCWTLNFAGRQPSHIWMHVCFTRARRLLLLACPIRSKASCRRGNHWRPPTPTLIAHRGYRNVGTNRGFPFTRPSA
jgi:hypothetical protein